MRHWDWDGMVEQERGRLIGLLAGLFAMIGTAVPVPRRLKREVAALLVPLESAVRRLISVMARDLAVPVPAAKKASVKGQGAKGQGKRRSGGGSRGASFALLDTLRDPCPARRSVPRGKEPRAHWLDDWMPREDVPVPRDDDPVDPAALRNRLEAARKALADLPAQAQRLARWYAKQEAIRKSGRWARVHPMRSGRPPGHVARGKRAVDHALARCHDLALRCLRMLEAEQYGA